MNEKERREEKDERMNEQAWKEEKKREKKERKKDKKKKQCRCLPNIHVFHAHDDIALVIQKGAVKGDYVW